jgi:predicted DNA binding CopG/RHH family protein
VTKVSIRLSDRVVRAARVAAAGRGLSFQEYVAGLVRKDLIELGGIDSILRNYDK